jgi:hypothetical protein
MAECGAQKSCKLTCVQHGVGVTGLPLPQECLNASAQVLATNPVPPALPALATLTSCTLTLTIRALRRLIAGLNVHSLLCT